MTFKRMILMISMGNRPWSKESFRTFQYYAEKVNADCLLIEDDSQFNDIEFGELSSSLGRKNKHIYGLKSHIPWLFMREGYDQVLVVDDTCVVQPGAENLFDIVGESEMGFTTTTKRHAQISFEMIRAFQENRDETSVELNPRHYANTGVVMYTRRHMDAFSPKAIANASPLLENKYPHQTLFYYLMKRSKVPICKLPKNYNFSPGGRLKNKNRMYMEKATPHIDLDRCFIAHFTGAYKLRAQLITETAGLFNRMWES